MEDVSKIIANLKAKKEILLIKKEENKEKIRYCDMQIKYYTDVCKTYNFHIEYKQKYLDKYNNSQKKTIFSFKGKKMNSGFIDERISELMAQINQLQKEEERVWHIISYFKEKKTNYIIINNKLDNEIFIINEELTNLYDGVNLKDTSKTKIIKRRKNNG